MRKLTSPEGVIEINPKEAPPNSILIRDNEERVEMIQKMLNKIGIFEEQRREKIFSPVFSSLFQAKEVLSDLLSPDGSIKVDEKSHTLKVEDGAYQLYKIEKAFSLLEEHNQILREKIFPLKYIRGEEIILKLNKFLSPRGSLRVGKNMLIVKDNNWVIERISRELEKLDTFEAQKETKVYSLKYVNAEELLCSKEFKEKASSLLSPQATIRLNQEKNALEIVALNWRFKELDKLISNLDIYHPQEINYELKYALASSLSKKLNSFLSDNGKIEINEEKNSLLIVDSSYYLKLIKQKLEKLDTFEKEKSPLAKIVETDEKGNALVIEEASYALKKIKEELFFEDTFEKQKIVKTYILKYADPSKVSAVLKSCFLSDRGQIICRGSELIVIDAPHYQAEVEKVIPLLDFPKDKLNK